MLLSALTGIAGLAVPAGLGAAVAGGVYANFSARVMPRLASLPDAQGIATMQRFNRVAEQVPFMTVFFGTAALTGAVLWRVVRSPEPSRADVVAAVGAGLYLAGFAMTIAYHVPRNNALARVSAGSPEAVRVWHSYLAEWTPGNTVRAALTLGGAALLLGASIAAVREPAR